MANLVEATVEIVGTRPLLWNRCTPEQISPKPGERTGHAGNDPEEWKRTVIFDAATRQLYILPTYIFGMARGGAKFTKRGRGSIQASVTATLQVEDARVYIDRYLPSEDTLTTDPNEPVYLDVSVVKNIKTRGRNVRYRIAASPGWRTTFHLLWDKTVVSRTEMQAVMLDAGRLVGLADGREIGKGRFEVVSFEVKDA